MVSQPDSKQGSIHRSMTWEDRSMTWDDLHTIVRERGGLYRLPMGTLREIGGFGRIGPNVRQVLSSQLASIGLGHLPAELPTSQEKTVLIYQYGTPAADVIAAVRGDVTDDAETALTQLNTSRDIDKIREATARTADLLSVLSDRCKGCLGPLD